MNTSMNSGVYVCRHIHVCIYAYKLVRICRCILIYMRTATHPPTHIYQTCLDLLPLHPGSRWGYACTCKTLSPASSIPAISSEGTIPSTKTMPVALRTTFACMQGDQQGLWGIQFALANTYVCLVHARFHAFIFMIACFHVCKR